MIFRKKKQKPVEEYWKDKLYMEIKSIKEQVELNESQHRLGFIDPVEYKETHDAINERIRQLESKLAFDNMMGNPMDQLEGMFNETD